MSTVVIQHVIIIVIFLSLLLLLLLNKQQSGKYIVWYRRWYWPELAVIFVCQTYELLLFIGQTLPLRRPAVNHLL